MTTALVVLAVVLLVIVLGWLAIRGLGLDTGWRWQMVRTEQDRAAVEVARQLAAATRRVTADRLTMRPRFVHLRAPTGVVRLLNVPADRERFERRVRLVATQLATSRHLNPLERVRGRALIPHFDYRITTWHEGPLEVLLTDTSVDPFMVTGRGATGDDLPETTRPTDQQPTEPDPPDTQPLAEPFTLPVEPGTTAAAEPESAAPTGEVLVKRTVGGERRTMALNSPAHFDARGWMHRSPTDSAVTVEFRTGADAVLVARVSALSDGVRVAGRTLPPGAARVLEVPVIVELRHSRLRLAASPVVRPAD